jgi:2-amino-4-hydroxy-6-hydroxymethyldihydropteridine diphosphokinase
MSISRAVLALGANLGDQRATLRDAVTALGPDLVAASDAYRTPPWGDPDQPDYLNAVVVAEHPDRDPAGWLARAHELESAAGRVRDPARRFGPRTLDVDVIAVWRDGTPVLSDDPVLTLPHPRAHLRAFVLVPWLDADPDAVLPAHGPVADLLRTPEVAADAPTIHRLGPLLRETGKKVD